MAGIREITKIAAGWVYIFGVSASFLVKHFLIGPSVKKRAVLALAAGIKEIT